MSQPEILSTNAHQQLCSVNALPLSCEAASVTPTHLTYSHLTVYCRSKKSLVTFTDWNPLHLVFLTKWMNDMGAQEFLNQMFIIPATTYYNLAKQQWGNNSLIVLFMMKVCTFGCCGFMTHCKFVIVVSLLDFHCFPLIWSCFKHSLLLFSSPNSYGAFCKNCFISIEQDQSSRYFQRINRYVCLENHSINLKCCFNDTLLNQVLSRSIAFFKVKISLFLMLFEPLITLKKCVYIFSFDFFFSNSRYLIIYFILDRTSLAEYIKSARHMLGPRYQSMRGSVITLFNTGVLVLTLHSL